jgi:hypothetical protein
MNNYITLNTIEPVIILLNSAKAIQYENLLIL